jgi:hypothetical protein
MYVTYKSLDAQYDFRVGQKVTWAQDFFSRVHPLGQQGIIEDIQYEKTSESGIMIKVDFYPNYLDSHWLKPINDLIP